MKTSVADTSRKIDADLCKSATLNQEIVARRKKYFLIALKDTGVFLLKIIEWLSISIIGLLCFYVFGWTDPRAIVPFATVNLVLIGFCYDYSIRLSDIYFLPLYALKERLSEWHESIKERID